MISVPIQEKIAEFGVDKYGQSLFFPDRGRGIQSRSRS